MKKYLILFALIIVQGCSSGDDDNGTTTSTDDDISDNGTTADADTPDDNTTTDSGGPDNNAIIEPLTFYEEQLTGLWVYYHNYDASYRYLIFMADRTGCAFEITSSEERVDYKPYEHWALLDPSEPEVFTISVIRSDDAPTTTSYTYYYAETRILRGLSGEIMEPGETSRVCD